MSRSSWSKTAHEAQPAVMRGSAIAGNIQAANNGVVGQNIPPSVPKYNLLQFQSQPLSAWGSNEVSADVVIDRSLGKVTNMFLELDVTFNNSSGTDGSAYLASSASLINRYDEMIRGSTASTVYSRDLFTRGMVLNSDQELNQHSSVWGIDLNGSSPRPASIPVSSGAQVKKTFFVPLVGLFASAQFVVCTISDELKYRFYMATNPLCGANGFVTDAGITVSLNSIQLWAVEAGLAPQTLEALKQQRSVVYRSIMAQNWQTTQANLVAGTVNTALMTAFYAASAGFSVALCNPSNDNGYAMTRYPLASLQILDANGATLTRNLSGPLVESVITPTTVPVASYFVNSPTWNTYILPWCSNLDACLNNGKVLGGLAFKGSEQISINIASTPGFALLETVTSYDYVAIQVEEGHVEYRKTAGEYKD